MEEKTRKIITILIMLIVVSLVGYIIYFIENFSYVTLNSQLNEVCTDYGYEKATSSKLISNRYSGREYKNILIECDDEVIINRNNDFGITKEFQIDQIGSEWCASRDKWGDCNYHKNNITTIIKH